MMPFTNANRLEASWDNFFKKRFYIANWWIQEPSLSIECFTCTFYKFLRQTSNQENLRGLAKQK